MLRREWPFCAAPARTSHAVRTEITLNTLMWRYRDEAIRISHIRVVRPTATLGRNSGYIFIGVLDIAGFAVDAVLGVDHKFWRAGLLHPFIDTGRAITRRGASEYVMLRCFL